MKQQRLENSFWPSQLLQTKLHPPVAKTVILRPRLFEKLNAALNTKLILISAPAGFGKTTLAANWLSHLSSAAADPVRYTWLSLDENDNELSRFLLYLTAALQKLDKHIGRGLPEALSVPELVDVEALLTALLNDLVALEDEFPRRHNILLLDDYHVLENARIDEALTFLFNHLPANLHLVLLSRIDPMLPLAQMRAKRHITEIRERDLRFSLDEAALFLRDVMGIAPSAEDIALLQNRTEGWIAGLQLAGLALQGSEDYFAAEFSGTHRYILDYLTDEVFHQQTPEMQHFLLETSVLNRMNAELCDFLRETTNSQSSLEALERANLFVVPLDQQRLWYRYHHLFNDLLRQRLRQTLPEKVVKLHQRASQWYTTLAAASNDEAALDEAFYHAVAAQDHLQVASLLEQFGDDIWKRGEHDKLRRWVTPLPDNIILDRPALNIFRGWLNFASGHYAEAELHLTQAKQMLDKAISPSELHGRVAAVQAFIATFKGSPSDTVRFAAEALEQLTPRSIWRSSAAIALGDAYSLTGNLIQADEAYQEALVTSRMNGNLYLALNASFKFAANQRQRGLLRQAYDICSEYITLAEKSGLAQTAMAGCLYALRGDILCEWNQLVEGLANTQQAMEARLQTRHIGFAGWITLYRIRSLLAARDLEQAGETLHRMEVMARNTPYPPGLRLLWRHCVCCYG